MTRNLAGFNSSFSAHTIDVITTLMTPFPIYFAESAPQDRGGGVLDARRQSKGFAQSTLCFRQLTTDGPRSSFVFGASHKDGSKDSISLSLRSLFLRPMRQIVYVV